MLKKINDYKSREEIIAFWNKYADNYILRKKIEKSYITKQIFKNIIYAAQIERGHVILDLGCGWGRILRCFYQNNYTKLVGIDITLSLLEVIRKDNLNISLINSDAHYLPFKDEIFDIIYSVRVFHYLRDIKAVLQKIKRVLKKGGCIIIIQPNSKNPYRKLFYKGKLIHPNVLLNLLKENGFKNVAIKYFGTNPFNYKITFFEIMEKIPILNQLGAFYLVKGYK